jgi:hypothetical protein
MCFSTLVCLLRTDCFQNDSANQCLCGTDAGCSGAGGPCKTQEENGFETTDAGVILGTHGDPTTGGGAATDTAACLETSCAAECWPPEDAGGP